MKYRQDFEKRADTISRIEDYSERTRECERAIEEFQESNPMFFSPLFRHACRVEFIAKRDMQEALTRWLMVKEEEQGRNWYIYDLEKHLMKNVYFDDERKRRLATVNGYYWNHSPTFWNKFEAEHQIGKDYKLIPFLSDKEILEEKFEDEPKKRDHKNYDPYCDEFVEDEENDKNC